MPTLTELTTFKEMRTTNTVCAGRVAKEEADGDIRRGAGPICGVKEGFPVEMSLSSREAGSVGR